MKLTIPSFISPITMPSLSVPRGRQMIHQGGPPSPTLYTTIHSDFQDLRTNQRYNQPKYIPPVLRRYMPKIPRQKKQLEKKRIAQTRKTGEK